MWYLIVYYFCITQYWYKYLLNKFNGFINIKQKQQYTNIMIKNLNIKEEIFTIFRLRRIVIDSLPEMEKILFYFTKNRDFDFRRTNIHSNRKFHFRSLSVMLVSYLKNNAQAYLLLLPQSVQLLFPGCLSNSASTFSFLSAMSSHKTDTLISYYNFHSCQHYYYGSIYWRPFLKRCVMVLTCFDCTTRLWRHGQWTAKLEIIFFVIQYC